MSDLTLEGVLFAGYGVALLALAVIVLRVTFRDACSSPRMSPAVEPGASQSGLVAVPAPSDFPRVGAGTSHLRLCDELDAVVVSLDAARAHRDGQGAA